MKTGYREEERAENALSDIKSSKFTKQICLSFEKIVLTKKKYWLGSDKEKGKAATHPKYALFPTIMISFYWAFFATLPKIFWKTGTFETRNSKWQPSTAVKLHGHCECWPCATGGVRLRWVSEYWRRTAGFILLATFNRLNHKAWRKQQKTMASRQ